MNEENTLIAENLQNEASQNETALELQPQQTEAEPQNEEPIAQDAATQDAVVEEATTEEAETQDEVEAPTEEAEAQDEAEASAVEPGSVTPNSKPRYYHERYYLRYCDGKRSTALDLDGTKSFLQGLGFDGGELRQARAGKHCAETYRNADKNQNNQMFCSYCGTEISGVDFYRLPDGRLRCTICSNSVVKTKAEVESICQRVLSNLESFFGTTIDVPVSIEVLNEKKLKKKLGMPLGTRDSQSILVLGVAINKKNKYKLLLENGAPRISLIATFAHEMTHIWQYTHWDNQKNFKQCAKSKRLLIYEGMAKWAEIQYLYLIGETTVAEREENITRNREDEYGVGFCLYEERYPLCREAMTCENTPFTSDRYPLD